MRSVMQLYTVPLRRSSDVALAREKAGVAASLFGFDSVNRLRIATAASELAHAVIEFGQGGELSIERGGPEPLLSLALVFRGRGAQLVSPDASWDPVRAAQLHADALAVSREPDWPVVARFVKHAPLRPGEVDDEALRAILGSGPETDALDALEAQSRELSGALAEIRAREIALARGHDRVAQVTHELRQPLTTIRGALEQLDAGDAPARWLPVALGAVRQVIEVVTDLHDSALLDAGALELDRSPLRVAELVAAACAAVEALAAHRRVRVIVEVTAGLVVEADAVRLARALTHLLATVVGASPAGSEVRVRAFGDAACVSVQVGNDGVGDLAAPLPEQPDARHGCPPHGTAGERAPGLGLAICRQLAALHGGTLVGSSEPGRATTFTLTLPR